MENINQQKLNQEKKSYNYSKPIGITLLVIAGLFLLGLISYWEFETWRVIDWLLIIFNLIAGVYLIKNG